MTLADYVKVAEEIKALWEAEEKEHDWIAPNTWIRALPQYTKRAFDNGISINSFREAVYKSKELTNNFFRATQNVFVNDTKRPFWRHQSIGPLLAFYAHSSIDQEGLKETAALYLGSPYIQNNYFDWCILDALIYAEIRAFLEVMMITRFGKSATNTAYVLCGGNYLIYAILRAIFWIVGFCMLDIGPLVGGIYLLQNGHEYFGWPLIILFSYFIISSLYYTPKIRAKARKNKKLLAEMQAIYQQLEGYTVSTRILKELIDQGAHSGIVFDGAVFAIVDRMYERDPSAFVRMS